jgi:hypothetical protein
MKMKLESRKFWLTTLLLAVAIGAVVINKATFTEATTFIQWMVGFYFTANVAEKATAKETKI